MIGMPEETIQTGSKIQLCIHTPENYWAYFNFSRGISIPCEKLKYAQIITI